MHGTDNLHIISNEALRSPSEVMAAIPLTRDAAALVTTTRQRIRDIIAGRERRLLAVVGPCSIHDPRAAIAYAQRLLEMRHRYADQVEIVMRVYFEKPRTTIGWKGLINDPHLNGSCDINTGMVLARQLLADLAALGMPAATELLDPVTPQYLADLICWTAIGARTSESQTHREMASGLSMPVGYKNSTDGDVLVAINAMVAAAHPHHFVGIDAGGKASIVATTGNGDGHLVLRGGRHGPNYDALHVRQAAQLLNQAHRPARLMIDCSHDNALKDWRRQAVVGAAVAAQLDGDTSAIMGVMIESNLVAGRQDLPADRSQLVHGQSITDACIDVPGTESMLQHLAQAHARRQQRV